MKVHFGSSTSAAALEHGYRFIWRRPDGGLQAARGQARIESGGDIFRLMGKAAVQGWFFNTPAEVKAYITSRTRSGQTPVVSPPVLDEHDGALQPPPV